MKKFFLISFICFIMLFALTGCGNKTVITTDNFIAKAENLGFETADITEQYADFPHVQEGTVAYNSDGAKVEFYVIDNISNATSMFNNNKYDFESAKGSSAIESSSAIGNYSSYSLTSDGYYMHVCRVENTLVFIKVEERHKDAVKELTKELGY